MHVNLGSSQHTVLPPSYAHNKLLLASIQDDGKAARSLAFWSSLRFLGNDTSNLTTRSPRFPGVLLIGMPSPPMDRS